MNASQNGQRSQTQAVLEEDMQTVESSAEEKSWFILLLLAMGCGSSLVSQCLTLTIVTESTALAARAFGSNEECFLSTSVSSVVIVAICSVCRLQSVLIFIFLTSFLSSIFSARVHQCSFNYQSQFQYLARSAMRSLVELLLLVL